MEIFKRGAGAGGAARGGRTGECSGSGLRPSRSCTGEGLGPSRSCTEEGVRTEPLLNRRASGTGVGIGPPAQAPTFGTGEPR